MPLTPFHLGPALLLGTLLPRRLDLPTLLGASVIVDVRAALVLFGPLDGRVHGIFTTLLGGTVVALALAAVVLSLPGSLQRHLGYARLGPTATTRPVVAAGLVGVYSHVLLDSVLYLDARPLFPLAWNPLFVGGPAYRLVYGGCAVAGVLGLVLLVHRATGRPTGREERRN